MIPEQKQEREAVVAWLRKDMLAHYNHSNDIRLSLKERLGHEVIGDTLHKYAIAIERGDHRKDRV